MVTTFTYLLVTAKVPRMQLLKHMHWLLDTFIIFPLDSVLLKGALKSQFKDFEDAVVERAAQQCGASVIITRNGNDCTARTIPAINPEE